MLDTLKETTTTARGVLQDALLGLPRIAVELDDPRSPIGRFSRSAKRLADSSENMVDAYRMAAAADGQDDQISRSNTRGQLQQMIFDYASTMITADQSLTAAARAWRITPDITKSENGSASTEKVPGKTADSIPAKLDAAKAAYQADLSNARRSLIAAIDIRLDAATDAGDLATVQSLQAAKTSAARDGTLPEDCKDASVLAAKTKMTQSISAANDRMAGSYRDAVKGYTRARQITEAIAVQDEFHASGLDAPATGGSASESTATPAPGEGPKETASASPSPTGFTPPVLPDGLTKIKLPAAVDTTAVGSGGRYLILHLKKLQQLAVFDVSAAKVIKYLPLPTNDIVFTAGEKKLFIGLKDLRQVQRWDLQKLEMELSVAAPEGGVGGLAMGAEATTPLLMIGDNSKHFWLVNPNTLHAEPYPSKNWGTEGSAWGPTNIHVSFDGSTAAANGGGWAGVELSNLAGGKVVNVEAGSYVNGDLSLAGNGSLIFHDWDNEIVRADLTSKVTGIDGHAFPADDPALSLSLLKEKKKAELVVFSNADPRPLITLRGLTELSHDSKMKLHDRIHLIPRAHVLITLGDGNDELILRKFDLAEELDAEGTDYLFVQSAPLCFIERGGRYVYKISALSKKGGVTYTLQSGPKGMAIDKDGTVKWSVPSRFPDDQTQVIVQISDASGQTIFHSYSINIADRITKR